MVSIRRGIGRSGLTDGAALAIGSIVNGVAAYAYIALGTRTFGAEHFAPVSILWTIWALTVAVVTFPLQHWVIRTAVLRGEPVLRGALPRVTVFVLTFTVLVASVCLAFEAILFGEDGGLFPWLAVLIVLEAAILGLARGVLSARGQFGRVSLIVGGENLLRLAAAATAVVIGATVGGFAAALLAGVIVLVLVPSSLSIGGPPERSDVSVVAALGGIAGGTLIAQVILTGQPLAVAFLGAGAETVTAVFATTAVFRAPYLVALGLALRSMQVVATAAHGRPSWLRSVTRLLLAWGLVVSAAVGMLGLWVGDDIVAAVFGAGTSLGAGSTGLIAAGSALALVGLGLTLVLIGIEGTHGITIAWLMAAAVAVVPLSVVSDPVSAVAWGFVTSELAAVLALAVFGLRGLRGLESSDQVSPSSPDPA